MAVHARSVSPNTLAAAQQRAAHRHDLALAATGGGLAAGAAMLAFIAACAARAGGDASRPLQLTAATLLGEGALEGGPLAVAAGLLLWGAVSVALGFVFAAAVPREFPIPSSAMLGVGYGLIVSGVMATLVLPSLNPHMDAEMPAMGGSWVIAYALFGLVIGLVPRLRRWFGAA